MYSQNPPPLTIKPQWKHTIMINNNKYGITQYIMPFIIITVILTMITTFLGWLCGWDFSNFDPTKNSNVTHNYDFFSGHTVTEIIIIDGKKFIKFTDNRGRTTLTQVIEQ